MVRLQAYRLVDPDLILPSFQLAGDSCSSFIAIRRQWLRKAIERALKAGKKVVDQEHLDAARLSARQLEAIGEEIVEFELFFESSNLYEVWQNLGLTTAKKDSAPATNNKGKDGRKPGVRNPKRDPVGAK